MKFNNITKEALKVRNALITRGLEIPFKKSKLNKNIHKNLTLEYMKKILILLNLKNKDISHDYNHIAEMCIDQIFASLDYSDFPKIKLIKNHIQFKEVITINNISITSNCKHQFSIINGKVKISYIPKSYIIELSNINSIINFFSQRSQLQECLTKQLSITLQTLLKTKNIAISINAKHFFLKYKNKKQNVSIVNTICLNGIFKRNLNFKKEFLKFY